MRFVVCSVVMVLGFASQAGAAIQGFTEGYAPEFWTSTVEGNGFVGVAEPGVLMLSAFNGSGAESDVTLSIAALSDGLFTFEWNYVTTDLRGPAFDPAFYINDSLVPLTSSAGGYLQSGTVSVNVSQGDIIGWHLSSTDSRLGPSTLFITNFSAPGPAEILALPEPATLTMFGLGLAGFGLTAICGRRRKVRG